MRVSEGFYFIGIGTKVKCGSGLPEKLEVRIVSRRA